MNRDRVVVLVAVGVGVCAALGVGVASQLLGQPLDTSVDNGVRAGLVTALVVLGVEYARQAVR